MTTPYRKAVFYRMKKLMYLILALVLTLSVSLLCSCDQLAAFLPDNGSTDVDPGEGNGDEPGGEQPGDNEGEQPGEDDNEPDPEPETVTLTFRYTTSNRLGTLTVVKDSLLTEEQVAYIEALRYNGFGFESWYTDAYFGNEFDPTQPVTKNLTIYGNRGKLAGENITYDYNNATQTLTFSGTGAMWEFKYNNDAPWMSFKTLCTTLVFSEGITTIGRNAFCEFTAISNVELPESVTAIGDSAFARSTVTDINFPAGLKSIGNAAFTECKGLEFLVFNKGLENISNGAFRNCTNVVSIVMNDMIADLGAGAFEQCVNIESAYYIGTEEQYNQIKIHLDNFWMNQLANTYYIAETKPANPGPYWHYNEDGDIEQWYYTVGYLYANGKVPFIFDYVDPEVGITESNISFRNAIYYRGYQFDDWRQTKGDNLANFNVGTRLTSDVRFMGERKNGGRCGETLTWRVSGTALSIKGTGAMWDFELPGDAPWAKRNITKVSFESGVTYIGSFAFTDHTGLESLNIPTGITAVSRNMLSGCNGLKYIYYQGNHDDMLAVAGLNEQVNLLDAVIYAKSASGQAGEGSYWRSVTVNGSTRVVAWTLEDGTLTVGTHEAVIINFTKLADTPWYPDRSAVTSVVIRDGITTVGHYSFDGMSTVTAITMPDSVNRISGSAFTGTSYYTNTANWEGGALYISKHLIKVDKNAVGARFTIKSDTVSLAEQAFEGCASITSVIVPKDLVGIYSTALDGLTSLESIYYDGPEEGFANLLAKNSAAAESVSDSVTVYFYSKNAPTTEGNYWHYGAQGGVEVWPAFVPTTPDGGEDTEA